MLSNAGRDAVEARIGFVLNVLRVSAEHAWPDLRVVNVRVSMGKEPALSGRLLAGC